MMCLSVCTVFICIRNSSKVLQLVIVTLLSSFRAFGPGVYFTACSNNNTSPILVVKHLLER